MDVNKYLLPATSNGHSDFLPRVAETMTTAGQSLMTHTTTVSANHASLMSATANPVPAYGSTTLSTSALVTLPSASQSQTLAASIVDLLPPPPGVNSAMQASTTSASQPVPAAIQATSTTASVSVGSSSAATPPSSHTAPTQSSVTATAATVAMAPPIVVVRQQQMKPYSGQSSPKIYKD